MCLMRVPWSTQPAPAPAYDFCRNCGLTERTGGLARPKSCCGRPMERIIYKLSVRDRWRFRHAP